MTRQIVLGITGASGALYGLRLLEVLVLAGHQVHLSISPAGREVLLTERGIPVDLARLDPETLLPDSVGKDQIHYHHHQDLYSPIASGSFLTDGMVVCPCSGGTLSAVAHGASSNLIHRAADVHLKERRKLILVPRETPLSSIQLANMLRAAEAGAIILPAMPAFYHRPQSIGDLVDFVVARICDQLSVDHGLARRWGSQ